MHHNYSPLERLRNFPINILGCVIALWMIDIITLYSLSGGSFSPWAKKQLISIIISTFFIILLGLINIRHIYLHCYSLYVISILLLLLANITGHTAMGAQRWIKVAGFTLQPSEFVKPALVLCLARYYNDLHTSMIPKIKAHIIPLLLIAIPVLLVLKQPNLGTATILLSAGIITMLVAGLSIWKFISAGLLTLVSLPIIWANLHSYQKRRVLSFLNQDQDPLGSGYNIIQSKIAIGSGGLTGRGFMKGSQSQLSFLPEKQTDFIFTVIAEEYGFLGSMTVLGLYMAIVFIGINIALASRHHFSKIFISTFVTMITVHVFINIAMISGMIPAVGIPLPFLSYGGSHLMAMSISLGILVNSYVYNRESLY